MTILLLLACQEATPTDDPCVNDPPLSWENFGQGHMRTHCNGCHGYDTRPDRRNGAPVGVDFDTYPMVQDWAERIYERTLVTKDMPPLGGPTEEELHMFEQWMLCEVLPEAE